MESIVEALLGLILGAILMYWIFSFFNRKKSKKLVKHQSTVILNKIKTLVGLSTVILFSKDLQQLLQQAWSKKIEERPTMEQVRKQLADIVKRHDLFLISDEVYREFTYDGNSHYSILELE